MGMKEPGAYGDFFEKFLFNSLNKLKLAAQRAGESRGRDTRLCVCVELRSTGTVLSSTVQFLQEVLQGKCGDTVLGVSRFLLHAHGTHSLTKRSMQKSR